MPTVPLKQFAKEYSSQRFWTRFQFKNPKQNDVFVTFIAFSFSSLTLYVVVANTIWNFCKIVSWLWEKLTNYIVLCLVCWIHCIYFQWFYCIAYKYFRLLEKKMVILHRKYRCRKMQLTFGRWCPITDAELYWCCQWMN